MSERVIKRLTDLGATLFRINLSHTDLDRLPAAIETIQTHTSVPVCLDTEGAQVRNGSLVGGTAVLSDNATVRAARLSGPGDVTCFGFYPDFVVDLLDVGDFISIDFNAVLVQVTAKSPDGVVMRVLNGGVMGQNKAVTVERPLLLPPLTDKDRAAIEIGKRYGIRHYALSFANHADDVDLIRGLCGSDASIISKIECLRGLANLADIAARSDAILIDRGDLSREIPIERIPITQQRIIRHCKAAGRKVYVATNLLESMVTQPGPTRAEVNDVITTLATGADGLVLAAETAIGANPIGCASMIVRLVHAFESEQQNNQLLYYPEDPKSLLVQPHGGRLVHRELTPSEQPDLNGLRRIAITHEDIMDCEQIAVGTYSPLTGFMDRKTLNSVLTTSRLPDGLVWPMPIILQLPTAVEFVPDIGERLVLTSNDGTPHALLSVSEVFYIDLDRVCQEWFGTADSSHPGVARLQARGSRLLAGDVTLLRRSNTPYRQYELTPAQTRFIFAHKGWSRAVGFHTRNPAHRVHEHLQLTALADTHADGLYISPVIGPKKVGDFLPDPILHSYQILIQTGVYPEGRVVLGSFATYSRFAGPREAIFTALCRKNMGCSHFIIGRDHAGVGSFYSPDAIHRYMETLGDLGIQMVFFDAIGYSPEQKTYRPLTTPGVLNSISGTQVRESLRAGKRLPDWFMRPSIQDMLLAEIQAGRKVFL